MKLALKFDKKSSIPFVIVDGIISEKSENDIFDGKLFDLQKNISYKFFVKDGHFRTFVHLENCLSKFVIELNETQQQFEVRFEPISKHQLPVKCIYLMCKDNDSKKLFDNGNFECPFWMDGKKENGFKKISLGIAMIQAFLLKIVGKTFFVNLNETNLPKVETYILNDCIENLWKLSSLDLWRYVANSIMNSQSSNSKVKYLVFVSFSRYNIDSSKPMWDASRQVSGYASHGGSDLALLSTHCLYTWPEDVQEIIDCLTDESMVNADDFMDDSNHRNTHSGCYSTTLGATIHELCHTFNLGHSNNGIMGNEFHDINQFFLEPFVSFNNKIWLTESQKQILLYHKWFQKILKEYETDNQSIRYVESQKLIISKEYLKALEIRRICDEFVLDYKTFQKYQIKCHSFKRQLSQLNIEEFCLFVIDKDGNIFERSIIK